MMMRISIRFHVAAKSLTEGSVMAFKPDPNNYYYLVARHSGKVLEVNGESTSADAGIQQNMPTGKQNQHFKFDAAGDHLFAIRARQSSLVVDVYGATLDDGARIVQSGWHAGSNQRFRLIDAGNGYYFIQAEHSGKFLDVLGWSQEAGGAIVQHRTYFTGDTTNQHFRPVLATADISTSLLPQFKRPMELARDVTMGALGLIPEIGGAVKFVTGIFWPDSSLKMFWDQITSYVDRVVESKISHERIIKLQLSLEAARINLAAFNDLVPGAEKAAMMNSVIVSLNTEDRPFFRDVDPEKTVTYLMTMGTLKLTLLRERQRNYAAIAALAKDDNAAAHLKTLKEAVKEYTGAAQRFRADLLKRRLDNLSGVTRYDGSRGMFVDFGVKDPADEREQRAGTMYTWRVYPPFHAQQMRTAETKLLPACKVLVKAQYEAELDALLASSRIWNSYLPDSPAPPEKIVRVAIGPFGGNIFDAVDLSNGTDIKGVRIYAERAVRGLQVKGAAGWGPLIGRAAGNKHEFELKVGERIVSVYGSTNPQLSAITFETSFGARISAGDSGAATHPWSADVPPELEAALMRITASPGEEGVEGITLHWDYKLFGEYPALARPRLTAKKRKAAAAKKTARIAAKKSGAKVAKKAAPMAAKKTKAVVAKKAQPASAKKVVRPVVKKPARVAAKKITRVAAQKINPAAAKKTAAVKKTTRTAAKKAQPLGVNKALRGPVKKTTVAVATKSKATPVKKSKPVAAKKNTQVAISKTPRNR